MVTSNRSGSARDDQGQNVAELSPELPEPPSDELPDGIRREDVHESEQDHIPEEHTERLTLVDAEDQRRDRGDDDEYGELGDADALWALEGGATLGLVQRRPRSEEQRGTGRECDEVQPDGPLVLQVDPVQNLSEEQKDKDRKRPGEHVARSAVVGDEMRHATADEPPFDVRQWITGDRLPPGRSCHVSSVAVSAPSSGESGVPWGISVWA